MVGPKVSIKKIGSLVLTIPTVTGVGIDGSIANEKAFPKQQAVAVLTKIASLRNCMLITTGSYCDSMILSETNFSAVVNCNTQLRKSMHWLCPLFKDKAAGNKLSNIVTQECLMHTGRCTEPLFERH